MSSFLDCWTSVATALFSQALSGGAELAESLPKPMAGGTFGFAATLAGDVEGRFSVVLDATIGEVPLVGEGVDQRSGWGELLREVADSAAGEMLARTGKQCCVQQFEQIAGEGQVSRAFELRTENRAWCILVRDEVQVSRIHEAAAPAAADAGDARAAAPSQAGIGPGIELLLDVELEATLRFGCREMPLGEILDLGPGDVIELDRHIADPVDLIVGDKIVAQGEVVLVNGNFGLRVTEVAAPRKRLESIRCLF